AEVMGMPTRRLKLIAFAIGAGIAALVGTVHAAWQGNVVPNRYDVFALIELYAMIVLGGLGSLPGVVIGAFIFTTLPEVLRNVELAGFLFYLGGLAGLIGWLKSSRLLIMVLGGTILGGLLLKLGVNLLWPGFFSSKRRGGGGCWAWRSTCSPLPGKPGWPPNPPLPGFWWWAQP
ncbi:MAG: hypothetical protein HYR94_10330, partial [Chloroflexi bacterium]|nr:hypothetical protein [Chloroflexota bacterium]